ncbi:MAG: thermostable hemolysin [Methylobacillus sp.]|nr:thermostable hemolysin [Methylobacillus sp.]
MQSVFNARMPRPTAVPKVAKIYAHGLPRYTTALCDADAPDRAELEQFIRDVFQHSYGASIRHFMPQLMSLRDSSGKLLAVCGLRHAGDATLFLETYLDAPIETLIAQRVAQDVARADIVEVGNLAVAKPGIAPRLFASLNRHLHSTGGEWVVFTAVPMLRNSFMRLNMPLEVLAEAGLDRIAPHERAEWGRYYDGKPQVMTFRRASYPYYAAD